MKRSLNLVAIAVLASQVGLGGNISGDITIGRAAARTPVSPAVYDLRDLQHPQGLQTSRSLHPFDRIAVWIEGGADHASPANVTVQQTGLRFEPELTMVPVGSTISFPNLDPLFHNIFSFSPAKSFDLGYYTERKSRSIVFSRPGIVQIYSHVHPEMYGVIIVTSSKWTAKPSESGTFSFPDVPVGRYEIVLWQRTVGLVRKRISVPASGEVRVSFRLPEDQE